MGFGGISIWQLAIILLIVILLFGTKRLKGIGSDVGEAIKGFRKSMNDDDKPSVEQRKGETLDVQAEREIGADERRQTLHNEKIMADLAKQSTTSNVKRTQPDATAAASTADAAAPPAVADEPAPGAPSTDDPAPRP